MKPETKTVIITIHDHVLCWPNQDTSNIDPCNHEEADTRIFTHIADAINRQQMTRIVVYTVDTDVVVLTVSAVARLEEQQIVVAFGSQQNRFIDTNAIFVLLGRQKARVFTMFHAITGCDNVYFFVKKSAMKTWVASDYADNSLLKMMQNPTNISGEDVLYCYLNVRSYEPSNSNKQRQT